MAIPVTLADLDPIASNNSPSGSDPIGTQLDDYLRAHAALIKQTSNTANSKAAADGTGTSGTWPISVSGNAATATLAAGATSATSGATAGKFNASTLLATTVFVQQALGNLAGTTQYTNQSATIPASYAGYLIVSGGTSNTLTLPATASVLNGSVFHFISQGGACTIIAQGADMIFGASSFGSTFALTGSDSFSLVRTSGAWQVFGGAMLSGAIGIGQTWQAVSRTVGVPSTNSTTRPIEVSLSCGMAVNSTASFIVNSVTVAQYITGVAYTNNAVFTAVIPPGASYYVTGASSIFCAAELK